MDKIAQQELEMAFYTDGFLLAENNVRDGIDETSILRMVEATYRYIDDFMHQFLGHCQLSDSQVDCKKGCSYCCHQSVFVLPYEAITLVKYCKDKLEINQYNKFREQVIEKDAITSQMTVNQFLNYTKPCPFLTDNVCGVYEVRPMACRLFLSMNVASCEQERNNPSDFTKYARLYEMPLHIGRMVNEGICAYLSEKGLKPMEWILESSSRILMTEEHADSGWFKGENIFQPREISKEEWAYLKRFDSA